MKQCFMDETKVPRFKMKSKKIADLFCDLMNTATQFRLLVLDSRMLLMNNDKFLDFMKKEYKKCLHK